MAILIIGLLLIVALSVLPSLWGRSVLARHATDRPDFPGTGGELARHLLSEMRLDHVKVEETQLADHYDPRDQTIRLTPQNMHGRSLTAVVVATHEVGHAMQDATGYAPLKRRTQLAKVAMGVQKVGAIVMIGAPIAAAIIRHPIGLAFEFFAGLLILSLAVVIHLATLPVEIDASFNRALPVLKTGQYIPEKDMPAAKRILQAAAFTYVAAALMSIINIARWLRILRM
jgi:hypothetical protein